MVANAGKSMLPSPVIGSQPAAVVKPELQQVALLGLEPVYEQHLLLPLVISLNDLLLLYSVGLMKPVRST